MFFVILIVAVLVISLVMFGLEVRERFIGNDRRITTKTIGHGAGVFATTFVICGMVALIVFVLAGAIVKTTPGDNQRVVSETRYKIAANSEIDTTSEFKFIAVEDNGDLSSKSIEYSEFTMESLDSSNVEVREIEHTHTWFAPFPIQTTTTIVVK